MKGEISILRKMNAREHSPRQGQRVRFSMPQPSANIAEEEKQA